MTNILLEKKGLIAVATINRPKALNALNSEVLTDLDELVSTVKADADIRALVITGSGEKAFVAGADIGEMSTLTKEGGEAFGKHGNNVFRAIETLPIPTIAAVNGFALGGGCELSMACDIRICADTAVFGQPETGLGITPGFGGTQRLARLVSPGMAKQQINTALWEYRGFDGPIVYEDGLVRCGDEQMTFTEAVGVLRNTGRDMRAHGWWAAPKTFWDREKCRGSNYMSYAYGACGAEVEIDPITGKTDVTDFVAVHDMGRIINHAATVGQVGGGVSMGVGYALTENADTPGGVTRAADLDSYLLPTALDMCPVRTVLLEEGAGVPPLLVHGIGEPATSIVAPAITNAMSAALGARIDTLPADLETVRAILDEKKR